MFRRPGGASMIQKLTLQPETRRPLVGRHAATEVGTFEVSGGAATPEVGTLPARRRRVFLRTDCGKSERDQEKEKQLQSAKPASVVVEDKKNRRRLLLVDWDDTLLRFVPRARGVVDERTDRMSSNTTENARVWLSWSASLRTFLLELQELGTVVVVTNLTLSWSACWQIRDSPDDLTAGIVADATPQEIELKLVHFDLMPSVAQLRDELDYLINNLSALELTSGSVEVHLHRHHTC
ncbi:hypothetical protein FVE85_8072 [Porphyridium purpureum]|uniref:Uncharacterized protein n=1 Tax=Porphyridium purpureum TaxID=35688 RepID=A0A5J4YN23_PORPP|nr:hypothetical protein FVE85_8072 [Porphyridium purpureum]|eukprot:POR6281..scf295_9